MQLAVEIELEVVLAPLGTVDVEFIRDAERVGISSRELDMLKVNDDGSVDVYLGPEAPDGWESNWIPTGEDWFTLFRFYGPEEPVFDKSFVLPNIEKVQ